MHQRLSAANVGFRWSTLRSKTAIFDKTIS